MSLRLKLGYSRRMRLLIGVSAIVVASSCGPALSETGGPNAAEGAGSAKAQQCLTQASAPRQRQPNEPIKIGVRHILVRHADSANAAGVTRTRGDACLRALAALEAVKSSGDFDKVVAEYSDERGAAARGGSLGRVARDDVQAEFADAAFELQIDELSYVVETKAGFHVILRTE